MMALVLGAVASTGARAATEAEVEQLVSRHIQPIVNAGAGAAAAVHLDGRTLFFNYGLADRAKSKPVSSDSLFNLASVGKVFIATLLAQAVKQDELSLDDPVARYVTALERGGDIRKVTLGQLASHTSGLPRTPQEPGHKVPTRGRSFSIISSAGERTAVTSPASRTSIPMPPSRCCSLRCNGGSTCRPHSSCAGVCCSRSA
jgi:beta-lactamase class C